MQKTKGSPLVLSEKRRGNTNEAQTFMTMRLKTRTEAFAETPTGPAWPKGRFS